MAWPSRLWKRLQRSGPWQHLCAAPAWVLLPDMGTKLDKKKKLSQEGKPVEKKPLEGSACQIWEKSGVEYGVPKTRPDLFPQQYNTEPCKCGVEEAGAACFCADC